MFQNEYLWNVVYHHQNKFKIKLISSLSLFLCCFFFTSNSCASKTWARSQVSALKSLIYVSELVKLRYSYFWARQFENKTGWRGQIIFIFILCAQPHIQFSLPAFAIFNERRRRRKTLCKEGGIWLVFMGLFWKLSAASPNK